MTTTVGVPPPPTITLLRLEGLLVGAASIFAFTQTGASGWLYLLVLVPDLSLFGMALGTERGALVYNVAHTYIWPLLLMLAGSLFPATQILPLGLIWATHIGADRALGYGLKYPDSIQLTHLGPTGPARKAARSANAS